MRALALAVSVLCLAGGGVTRAEPVGIRVPPVYRVSVFAHALIHPTAMGWGPGGRLFVTEDVGRLVEIVGGTPRVVASGLRTPLGLAGWRDSVFLSEAGRLERLRMVRGRVVSRRVLVSGLPHGLHQQDNIVVGPDGLLYFGSGSTCDACVERDPRSAAILSVRMDGSALRVVATGLRNPYGLAFQPRTKRLFASVNGRDKLGANEPAEMVVRIQNGARYGWPDCWPSWRRRRLVGSCRGVARPAAYLEPHSSADGIAFWRGGLYVAEWGEYYRSQHGRHVVRMTLGPEDNARRMETFAEGFDHPLALLPAKHGLLVADWGRGVIYRISHR